MGVVFEGRHLRLGHRVAIKVLGPALREHPELVTRFEREARAAGALSSAHAVKVFDIDVTADGTPFIVMELLDGHDLASVIDREGPQPVARAVRWILEACEAIAEAHRLGIVHRDLKPSNLFLAELDDRSIVKVLDFGVAKRVAGGEASITQAVAPLGTPQYMSPEQVRCAKYVDKRSDVWSLGVTLYELVTGQTPFGHEEASACIASIAADPVPDPRALRPDLPDAFVTVLMGALAKNVSERYPSVDALVAALAPFAAVSEVLAPPGSALGEVAYDHTVPPAVARSRRRPARALRPSFVMTSAAVLGVAALLVTPKWAATRPDVASPATAAAFASAPQREVQPAPSATTEPPPAPPAIEPSEVAPAPAAPVAPKRPRPSKPKADRPSALADPSGVHGGLSSPGF
ncbi:MAG: serine/threonine protein kinase [Labilithrix sp.]|nr:serine/threonine protein kinase [Labilithrix sp.]